VHRGDGLPDRVRRTLLQRGGEPEQAVVEVSRYHAHLASGEGPRLVEDDGVGAAEALEDGVVEDHDGAFERVPDPGSDRERGREPERARTRDDEHREPDEHRLRHPVAEREVRARGEERDREHDRDEYRRQPVGELLDAVVPALEVPDELRDAVEAGGRVRTDFDRQRAVRDHGAADDGVAGRLPDRHRLAGDDRLVDGGVARDRLTIDRDPLAGADEQAVAGGEVVDSDFLGLAGVFAVGTSFSVALSATDQPPSAVDLHRGEIREQLRRALLDRVLVVVADGDDHDDRDGHVVVYRRRIDEDHGERAVGVRAHRRDRDE